jgi:hypothetical protein
MARTRRSSRLALPSWARVCALHRTNRIAWRRALAEWFEAFRDPVYACLFACARDADHARDLTQAFFASLPTFSVLRVLGPDEDPRRVLMGAVLDFLIRDPRHEMRFRRDGQPVIALKVEPGVHAARPKWVEFETLARIVEEAWAHLAVAQLLEAVRREGLDAAESKLVDCIEAFNNDGLPESADANSEQGRKREVGAYLLRDVLTPDPFEEEEEEEEAADEEDDSG